MAVPLVSLTHQGRPAAKVVDLAIANGIAEYMEATVDNEDPLLLSVTAVARLVGLGKSKTWEEVATGKIFSVRVGRRRLVPRDAVERYVAELVAEQELEAIR